ncbi:DNA-binding IclR family transcriptional regulator [Rhizobium sp. BK313]|uniref:IclR family transcriptional regulator n=1 Tax=Rhizobium sp. BK313 TaxID=2587081 RepID=UPI0010D1382D|nr:IclR family transcriptional regulator [Rhizobium sp. BK313]MBB3459284.1 DNA-binding IclR family transcriptional regulator [Rhizobium sp. BK313]
MTEGDKDTQLDSLVTVRRTMEVLEMLADADAGLSLSDIAKALDVNKSIALRITTTLETLNYLYRNSENKRFYAGYKISNVGLRLLSRARLIDECQPVLRRLAEQTGELVLFSVLDRDVPRWVLAATGLRRRLQVEPMTSMEIHSTATGKAWLATLPEDEALRRLQGGMRALTAHTITDPDSMIAELRNIRATGISYSNQENEVGIASVATGIRPDPSGPYVGFVSITAPLVRASPEDFERYRQLVQYAAHSLGDRWPLPVTVEFSDGVVLGNGLRVL